jgi:hypothetical protein
VRVSQCVKPSLLHSDDITTFWTSPHIAAHIAVAEAPASVTALRVVVNTSPRSHSSSRFSSFWPGHDSAVRDATLFSLFGPLLHRYKIYSIWPPWSCASSPLVPTSTHIAAFKTSCG